MLESQLEESSVVQKVCRLNVHRWMAIDIHLSPRKELLEATEEETVYKVVGPILLKQDHAEARSHVEKRLEYIKSEM